LPARAGRLAEQVPVELQDVDGAGVADADAVLAEAAAVALPSADRSKSGNRKRLRDERSLFSFPEFLFESGRRRRSPVIDIEGL
jgi:hypothetical protein